MGFATTPSCIATTIPRNLFSSAVAVIPGTHPQDFRERVIRDFPDLLVVQLSQSVHFEDKRRTPQERRVFGSRKILALMIREPPSLATAQRLFLAIRWHSAPVPHSVSWRKPPGVRPVRSG